MATKKNARTTSATTARPVMYSDAVAEEFLGRIAAGETATVICEDEHMPAPKTFWEWRKVHGDFEVRYMKAREEQMHAWADQIVGLIENTHRGNEVTVPLAEIERVATEVRRTDTTVTFRLDRPFLAQAKEMVSVRKWLMGKVLPAQYGEKLAVTHTHGGLEEKDDAEIINDLREAMEGAGVTVEQIVELLRPQGVTH